MSLFSVTGLVLFATFGNARTNRGVYENGLYPIKIQLSNDYMTTEWSFMAPKNIARYIKNLIDCSVDGHVMERLEEADLKIYLRTSPRGIIVDDEMDRRAGQILQTNPLQELLRRWNVRPKTEMGPGIFKHSTENFDDEALGKDMKKLWAIKKRQEEQNKDLNEGRE